MKKIDGYRDISADIYECHKTKSKDLEVLSDKGIIRPCIAGSVAFFWYDYFNVPVLFKEYSDELENGIYCELIGEELSYLLGIRTASYEPAVFGPYKGVITPSFNKPGYIYIPISKVLQTIAEPWDAEKYNNLEDIWYALEKFMKSVPKLTDEERKKNVSLIMNDLTDYFAFQIICGECDMHSDNLVIEMSMDHKEMRLAPSFDKGILFNSLDNKFNSSNSVLLGVETLDNSASIERIEALRQYLSCSSQEFIDRFMNMYKKLGITNSCQEGQYSIDDIMNVVEEEKEITIPLEFKRFFRAKFNNNLESINKVLESYIKR